MDPQTEFATTLPNSFLGEDGKLMPYKEPANDDDKAGGVATTPAERLQIKTEKSGEEKKVVLLFKMRGKQQSKSSRLCRRR